MAIQRFAANDPQDNSSLAWSTVSPAAGDLVLLFFTNDGGDNQTGLSGFTRLDSNVGSSVELGTYYRICTGSETGNVFTNEGSFGVSGEEYAWHCIKIPAGEWHGVTAPEVGTASVASTGTPNVPSLSPSWEDEAGTIFFIVVCRDDDDGISAAPSGYDTNFQRNEGGSSGPEIATSWRIPSPAVTTENPGTWTVSGTAEEYITNIVAVRPLPPGPVITSIDDDNDTVDTRTGVVIAGSSFGASETGQAKIEISDDPTYGDGTIVEVDVTAWSDTSITVTLRQESDAAALATLLSLPLSPAYLWVTDSDGDRNAIGFQFVLRAPGPTPVEAVNTPATLEVDTTYLVRARVENSGGVGDTEFRWAYSHEGGAWTAITTSSSVVKAVAANSFDDGDDVPEVIGGSGDYASNNDAASEDGTPTLPAGFPASGAVEFVLAFQIVGDDVDDEDAIELRVELADGTPFDAYTNTPTIAVSKAEEEASGAGSGVIPAATATGAATAEAAGAGSPSTSPATATGSAAAQVAATGAGQTPAATATGAAGVPASASGAAPTTGPATGTGAAIAPASASGSQEVPAATGAGAATAESSATGSPGAPAVAATGAATTDISASGAASAPAATATGQAGAEAVATGAGTTAAVTGSGNASRDLGEANAEGQITAPATTATGAAAAQAGAAGTPETPSTQAAGAATAEAQAAGAATAPAIAGSGFATIEDTVFATGAATIAPATGSGAAAAQAVSSGEQTAPPATADGQATAEIAAAGAATSPAASAAGTATTAMSADAAAAAPLPAATGAASVQAQASGAATAPAVQGSGQVLSGAFGRLEPGQSFVVQFSTGQAFGATFAAGQQFAVQFRSGQAFAGTFASGQCFAVVFDPDHDFEVAA